MKPDDANHCVKQQGCRVWLAKASIQGSEAGHLAYHNDARIYGANCRPRPKIDRVSDDCGFELP